MHSDYRKAKKFKLQYDPEEGYYVDDEFMTGSKRQVKNYNWYYERQKNLWQTMARPIDRYLVSSVGKNWDTVYSDICNIANNNKEHVGKFIRDRARDQVEKSVRMIDGIPCAYSRWSGLQEIGQGDLYVHPESGKLCRVPQRKKEVYSWRKAAEPKTKKFEDGAEFKLVKRSYKRKISSGVFEEVFEYNWHKWTTEPYWGTQSYSERVFGEHLAWNWKTSKNELVTEWYNVIKYRPKLLTRDKLILASKKDIKKYKLNEGETE